MFGLDQLIAKIFEFGREYLLPWEIIDHYNRGVRLRFGRVVTDKEGKPIVLGPGFHWKWPIQIDDILTHMVKVTTMDLSEQTITTHDDRAIVVRGVLKYEVQDVATLLLECDSPAAAVADISMGIIRDAFVEKDWAECNDPKFPEQIAIKIRREAKKWGIYVIALTLTDLSNMKSFRLLNSYSTKNI